MVSGNLDPGAEYLTRSDIARILQISPKQAGRLMEQMPCVLIGTTHRRVSRSDFRAWLERKKLDEACEGSTRPIGRLASQRVGKATPIKLMLASSYDGRVVRRPRPLPK